MPSEASKTRSRHLHGHPTRRTQYRLHPYRLHCHRPRTLLSGPRVFAPRVRLPFLLRVIKKEIDRRCICTVTYLYVYCIYVHTGELSPTQVRTYIHTLSDLCGERRNPVGYHLKMLQRPSHPLLLHYRPFPPARPCPVFAARACSRDREPESPKPLAIL